MLSALDQKGQLIHLLDEIPERQTFTCPACHSPVRLKNGKVMRPHFAHVSLQTCQLYSENESAEHLNLKAELYAALSRSEEAAIEVFLPQLEQIADLLVNGHLALEVQCSRLSEDRLRQRTHAYHKTGFQVLWLLGRNLWLGKRISPLQRQFLYFSQNLGFYLWELDISQRQIRLKYLIYEDLHGICHHLTKSCSFDDDVMAFLRWPYCRQTMASYVVKQDQQLLTYIQRQLLARHPRWLRRQADAYSKGSNLLAQTLTNFYPQVRPFEAAEGFCQIETDLSAFRAAFFQYYKNQKDKSLQKLYPPAFYAKIVEKEWRNNHVK